MWFDESLVQSVVDAVPVWLAVLLVVISYLGSIYLIAPVTVVTYLRGRCWRTATWPGIILGAYALFVALKPLSDISRPSERGVDSPLAEQSLPAGVDLLHQFAVDFDTASFPSGHAIAVTVFIGLVVADVDIGTFRQRLLLGVGWVGAVLFTRVGLGVHYIGDVVGGIIIGLAFLGVMVALRNRLHERSWRGFDAAEGAFIVAAALAVMAIIAGRQFDGAVLVGASVAGLFAHRRFHLRSLSLSRQVLRS